MSCDDCLSVFKSQPNRSASEIVGWNRFMILEGRIWRL